jgi:hypothetical protein
LLRGVAITIVPKEAASFPVIGEAEEWDSAGRVRVNGSLEGNKWQKEAAGYSDALDGEDVVVARKGSKGKGEAPSKGNGKAIPQPKEVTHDGECGSLVLRIWMTKGHDEGLVALVNGEQVGDLPMPQRNSNMGETPPPQDAEVSLNFLIGSEAVLMCDF